MDLDTMDVDALPSTAIAPALAPAPAPAPAESDGDANMADSKVIPSTTIPKPTISRTHLKLHHPSCPFPPPAPHKGSNRFNLLKRLVDMRTMGNLGIIRRFRILRRYGEESEWCVEGEGTREAAVKMLESISKEGGGVECQLRDGRAFYVRSLEKKEKGLVKGAKKEGVKVWKSDWAYPKELLTSVPVKHNWDRYTTKNDVRFVWVHGGGEVSSFLPEELSAFGVETKLRQLDAKALLKGARKDVRKANKQANNPNAATVFEDESVSTMQPVSLLGKHTIRDDDEGDYEAGSTPTKSPAMLKRLRPNEMEGNIQARPVMPLRLKTQDEESVDEEMES